jgi:quinol monooxygenase YgiN
MQRNLILSLTRTPSQLALHSAPGETNMVHIIAISTTKLGRRGAILDAIRANLPVVLAEKGCIEYGPAIDADDINAFQAKAGPDTVFAIEK